MTYKKLGTRLFYKFSKSLMVTVLNMEKTSSVEVTANEMAIETVTMDNPRLKDITEEEFNAAKSEAMKRLQSEQI